MAVLIFEALAKQIERLLKYAHKAEKLIPENAIKTGTKSVSLAVSCCTTR